MHPLLWALLIGCGGGGSRGECDETCPVGTRKVSFDQDLTVVSGSFAWSRSSTCEVLCEPEQACAPPDVPVVTEGNDGIDVFECQVLGGFALSVPPISEVDPSRYGEDGAPALTVDSLLAAKVSTAALADLDNDGLDDVIVYNGWQGTISHGISDGAGGFTVVSTAPITPFPNAFEAVDVDGDQVIDLLGYVWADAATWWRGVGDGTYEPGVRFTSGAPTGMALADLDDDGNLDAVMAISAGQMVLSAWFGDGAGGFSEGAALRTHTQDIPFSIGDVDGDGRIDVAVGLGSGEVYRQGAGRTFALTDPDLVGAGGFPGGAPVLADLDGDGLADWSIAATNGDCGPTTCTEARRSLPGGGFEALAPEQRIEGNPFGIGSSVGRLAYWSGPFDLDGDGRADFAGHGFSGPTLAIPRSGAPYLYEFPFGIEIGSWAVGDVDGDGVDELVGFGLVDGDSTRVEVAWL